MILYAVIVAFMVCLMLAFKGPGEIYLLHKLGINLMDAFEATASLSRFKGLIKSGSVLAILIVQPITFASIFLKIVDKIFALFVIPAVEKKSRIGARNLDRSEAWLKKTGKTEIGKKYERVMQTDNIGIASVDKSGTASASFDDYIIDRIRSVVLRFFNFLATDKIIKFRGSFAQLFISLILLIVNVLVIYLGMERWFGWAMLLLLIVIVAPSYVLYLTYLAYYADIQDKIKYMIQEEGSHSCDEFNQNPEKEKYALRQRMERERTIQDYYDKLAEELRKIGETRSGKYHFQSDRFTYRIFRKLPILRRIADSIPLI